jgi:hypothetical protein
MLADKVTVARIAVFTELIENSGSDIGRTALMKMCYFLQTLKNVPLGYDFSLYSYGPFDSEVLGDLRTAEDMSVIESNVESFSGGYQYSLSNSEGAAHVRKDCKAFITKHAEDISWVANTFGSKSASELELLSTIVYVDQSGEARNFNSLRDKVKLIKPRFSLDEISRKIEWLNNNALLATQHGK